jgi:hypothetical protein
MWRLWCSSTWGDSGMKIVQTTANMNCGYKWFFLVLVCTAGAGCAVPQSRHAVEPAIISVEQWGGLPADESMARQHKISRITLHHQGLPFARGRDPRQYLRDLQNWSRKTRGWIDIPYHFVVDLDGHVYAGRDIRFAGDTNTSYDPAGHALIEVVGNFDEVEPNASQLDAVVKVMAMLVSRYQVPVENILGHRDVAPGTECPGKNLYRYLEKGFFRAQVGARLSR